MGALITAALFAGMCAVWGLAIGTDMGADKACASVKMEWVKDKCMKVTREEVK